MKTLAYVLILLGLLSRLGLLWASEEEEKRIDLELQITSLLTKDLSRVIPEKTFAIFTDINLDVSEVKVISEAEKTQRSVEQGGEAQEEVAHLPGFEKPASKQAVESAVRGTKEKYTYRTQLGIRSIKVTMVLHSELDDEKKQLAKELIQNKIKANYGERGSVVFKETDLHSLDEASVGDEAFSDYLKRRLDYVLAGAVLFILLILLALILRPRNSAGAANKPPRRASSGATNSGEGKAATQSASGTSGEDSSEHLKVLDDLIWHVDTYPLIARTFLKKTTPQERNAIFANLTSPATKEVFAKLFGEDLESIELSIRNAGVSYGEEDLVNMVSSLNQFVKVQRFLEQRTFGYLNFITNEELADLVKQLNEEEKSLLLPHLNAEQCNHYLSGFSVTERAQLIKNLAIKSEVNAERELALDQKLRKMLSAVTQNMFTAGGHTHNLVDFILENDPNVADVVALLKKDGKFAEARDLSKYQVTFEELLNMDAAKIAEVFAHCENEAIATSLVGRDKELISKVLSQLSPMRKQVVESLFLTVGNDPQKIAEAQTKILKHYRAL